MQLTFNIPEDKKDLFIEAWSDTWQETIDGAPNPETRAQFAKRQIKMFLAERVKSYEAQQTPPIEIT